LTKVKCTIIVNKNTGRLILWIGHLILRR